MTTLRFVAILSKAKDLYEMILNHILNNRVIYSFMSSGHSL